MNIKSKDVLPPCFLTDRIARVDPKSGQVTEHPLPRPTTPVTFWVGNNHGASIVKLEPLD